MSRLRVRGLALSAAALFALVGVHGVAACGGLVAPNGAVRLARASTLVAWHNGVEHYMTSFAYVGDAPDIGWIVPLPAVPDKLEKGGAWTLQRLAREAQPVLADDSAAFGAKSLAVPAPAQVLQTAVIDALDITVLRGSGQAVLDWCAQNHFALNPETRAHILAYADRSPIFMAAKYDLTQARLHLVFNGDGTPVLITMRTPRLWVPLEVLANASDLVNADVYLLTDTKPTVAGIDLAAFGGNLPNAQGMQVVRQEPMNDRLHLDLSSDRNMGWVQAGGWFTALRLEAPGTVVTYDMTVVDAGLIFTAPMGAGPDAVATAPAVVLPSPLGGGADHTTAFALVAAGGALGLALLAAGVVVLVGRRSEHRTL
ncbi:MAG TPA: DUF2330 domain-containing protein [Candidatus Dormibacteraeota bacterium]